MPNFINNNGNVNLKDRLLELISKSQELKFLVGFFYFSGIRELYDGIKDKKDISIKVLVGLNADKINSNLVEYAENGEDQFSDDERAYKFLESVKKTINSDDFDNEEFFRQVKFFLQLIRDNKLIIRKTFEPNHSKIYLFKLEKDQVGRKNMFITGSSNLTKPGLTTQHEFNVEISDFGFENTEQYFDGLWEKAVKITENDSVKQRLISIIEKETHIKDISPFEAFVLVLKAYLDSFKQKQISPSLSNLMTEKGYVPYKYQLDAVSQSLAIIEENGGVIIADVVGLGKSIIASMVAKELGKRGIIICPPGLIGDANKNSGWQKYAEEFGLYGWEIRSLGELDKVAEFVNKTENIEVVIIDEAHRFRNEDTQDYEYLKNICRNKIVILLTATPFNNTPDDILSLLELFIAPKKSTITLENDLKAKFRAFSGAFNRLAFIKKNYRSANQTKKKQAQSHYKAMFEESEVDLGKVKKRAHYLSKQIRDVIEPVTIRRNRLDLQNNPEYKKEVKMLSKIEDPQEWYYELTQEQSQFYDQILGYFKDKQDGGRFTGAIYRPFEYEIEKAKITAEKLNQKENFQFLQQRNLFDFMRRLVVKRFESSFGSFEKSIRNFKKVTENAQEFIKNSDKYILDRDLLEKIYNLDSEEIEKELEDFSEKLKTGNYTKNNRIYDLKNFDRREEFIKDIESDIILFNDILDYLKKLNLVKDDPKTKALITGIRKILEKEPEQGEPKRKVIIFTEYFNTTEYLSKTLSDAFSNRVLVVSGGLSQSKILNINKNFDASQKEYSDEYDILLSTDRISEGFNLNRAGIVINYDIPWNPVRVIQRVGRINRISKKVFNSLNIVNFFPTEKGASFVRSREIAQHKMFLIHSTLGEDSKIFDIDEEPTPAELFNRLQENPDKLEEESFYSKISRQYNDIAKEYPELISQINNYPARIKIAKKYGESGLLVFIRKGRLYVREMKAGPEEKQEINATTLEEVYEKIACKKEEKNKSLSGHFWGDYAEIKQYKEKVPPLNESTLEQRALNNLISLIRQPWEKLLPFLPFLRSLREDITDYGTLADYTIRRIANLENSGEVKKYQSETIKEVQLLQQELGENYLAKEKSKNINLSQEIIIAIENQK